MMWEQPLSLLCRKAARRGQCDENCFDGRNKRGDTIGSRDQRSLGLRAVLRFRRGCGPIAGDSTELRACQTEAVFDGSTGVLGVNRALMSDV